MSNKTPSIISTIITVLLLLLTAALGLFGLVIALNGYNDRAGGPALATTFACNGIAIILAAILAWRFPKWLVGKFNWNNVLAVIVSIVAGTTAGGMLSFVSIFIGILIADTIWNAR